MSKLKGKNIALCIDEKYMERKEKITSFFSINKIKDITRKELIQVLSIPKEDTDILDKILFELEKELKILGTSSSKGKKYSEISVSDAKTAIYISKQRYGFAVVDEKEEDFYIPYENSNHALNGDRVLVIEDKYYDNYYMTSSHKRVGKIIGIVKRNIKEVIGKLNSFKGNYYLEPLDSMLPNILIRNKESINRVKAVRGDFVRCKIVSYPSSKSEFEIEVTEKIAEGSNQNSAYVKSLYVSLGLDKLETFNNNIQKEVEKIETSVSDKELAGREDRTLEKVVTIDGDDSKDFDDAVYVKKNEDGTYTLSVYIADVSHYVKEDSFLDKEAIERGTSIYIPGNVFPMLPKELSNGICSLNEGVKRLVLGIDMHIDTNGNVLDDKVFKGVIVSKKRMTYNKVYKCINKIDTKVLAEYKEFLPEINVMKELAEILNKKRMDIGSINFNIPEIAVLLNEDGSVKDVHEYNVTVANNIIEEFMLIANETIAEKFCMLEAPFIYRVHDTPDEEKLIEVNEFLKEKKKSIKNIKKVTPKSISMLLESLEEDEDSKIVSNLVLRALKTAKYSSTCDGHFGLAFKYYCHFTSPIRRYPDLFIHRVISSYIENGYVLDKKDYERFMDKAPKYAIISSDMEKNATKVERDFDSLYMTMFMQDKKGKIFDATVSSVTPFGMFVRLESGIEGLVSVRSLAGYYDYDDKKRTLRKGKTVHYIGEKVKVKVIEADIRNKQIDFKIV